MKSEIHRHSKEVFIVAAAIAVVTALIYLPALNNGFVNLDDDSYVYNNTRLGSVSSGFIAWAFTSVDLANYHPLTWVSYALDHCLWGTKPFGYHLSNILVHGVNTFLIVVLVARLFRAAESSASRAASPLKVIIASGLSGLLFGTHPLHVESVAWISERKDVLYCFFSLVSVLAYLRYVTMKDSRRFFYWATVIAFVLALLSKPMAVTLPAVLLILDIYPLNRVFSGMGYVRIRQVLLEKVPFFALSALFSVVAVFSQRAANAIASADLTLSERLLTSARAAVFYLQKFFLPTDLAPFYPLPRPVSFAAKDVVVLFVLSGITFICCKWWHKSRLLMMVWAYYLVTLLPVLGIIQVGGHAAADRYTYMPLIGPMSLVGAGVADAGEKIRAHFRSKIGVVIFSLVFCGLFIVMFHVTALQIKVWENPLSLWSREFALYPNNTSLAYRGRAEAYYRVGDFDRAVADYTEAVRVDPGDYRAYASRGIVRVMAGRYDLALTDFNRALSIEPGDTRAAYYKNLVCRGTSSRSPAWQESCR